MNSIEKMMNKLNQKCQLDLLELDDAVVSANFSSDYDYYSAKDGAKDNTVKQVNKDSAATPVSIPEWDSILADEYRRIKRPLLNNAFGSQAALIENANVIVVTSSVPGEGKSFTARNLAQSIALERDKTVLLVDADAIKSSLSKTMNLVQLTGLVDVLLDKTLDLESVIVDTDLPCMKMIPAGIHHEHLVELLASNRMKEIRDEFASRYLDRVVIIDSPPVLVTPETKILCDLAGQIVFVVESGKTPQVSVQQALELISENAEKPIGLVLNKNHALPGLQYHGEYYGY